MSALKVLHIAPYSPETWAYGGIPRVVGAFCRGLTRRGHTVTVCATDVLTRSARLPRPGAGGHKLASWAPLETESVTTRIFPNVSNRLAYDWQFFTPIGLTRFLRCHAGAFDVAHLHACRNLPVTLAAWYLRRARVPFVMGPNGTAPRIERRQMAKWVWDLLLGEAPIRDAAAVLAVSMAERRQLCALGVSDSKIHVIPNPIELDEFDHHGQGRRSRARFGSGDEPVVLFLGKLTPRKRVATLVEAVGLLRDSRARLVVAGNDMGAMAETRAAVRSHGLEDRTVFTGLLRGVERLEALTAANVVVYPSDHEVFGLVPLEALLCSTPVVVADDSGCDEIIGETGGGQVIPLGDVRALSVAIADVLEHPAVWNTRATAAAARVRQRFGRDFVTAQLDAVYHAVRRRVSTPALEVIRPAAEVGDVT